MKSLLCARQLSWAFSLVLTHLILIIPRELGLINFRTLQVRKLRQKEVKLGQIAMSGEYRSKPGQIILMPME